MGELSAKTPTEVSAILSELINRIHPVFGNKLKKVILFGSYARGDFDNESDIDVMVMVDEEDSTLGGYSDFLTDILVDIDLKYDVVVAAILQSEKKFVKYQYAIPFYDNVARQGVVMYEQ